MSKEAIRNHFKQALGKDVDVSFIDLDDPSKVVLYRKRRIPEQEVRSAYAVLLKAKPALAGKIEHLMVSYEENSRLKWRGVTLPTRWRDHNGQI